MMRITLTTIVLACGMLAAGAAAQPQYRGRFNGYGYGYRAEPLDHVRADLERAARDMYYLSGGEIRRINKVREEISEFQRKWERGRYDKGELDDVIGSLQRVVDHNRLQPRDRGRLLDDLFRLREFRSRGGRY